MSTKTRYTQAIYNFIEAFWKERGYAPTQKEIARGVGLSSDTARLVLRDLQSQGAVDWNPRAVRTIRITAPLHPSTIQVAFLGSSAP